MGKRYVMESPSRNVSWEAISPKRKKDLLSTGWTKELWDGTAPPEPKVQVVVPDPEYEFGGPVNVIFMMLGLPIGVWALFLACNANSCAAPVMTQLPDLAAYTFYSHEAVAVVGLWFVWLTVLWIIVPGEWVAGCPLSDGSRLQYKMNGFSSMVISYAALAAGHYYNFFNLVWLHDHQLELATASIIWAALLSVYLFAAAQGEGVMTSTTGNTGTAHYDFFIGRELNPRIGNFDLKVFFELRPGLIGWTVLNAAMAVKQFQDNGAVSLPMVIVNAFQLLYVVDALWNEQAILSTMDITSDGFGYMLAFGDIAWVPFTYGLQARYLAFTKVELSNLYLAIIVATVLAGYWVFRGSNGQKNTFRPNPDDPSVRHLKTLQTKRGTKLIIDGWWGKARHINYFGDWIMAWAWCLPCGLTHVIPYFYVVYFAGLLVHREMRDEHLCRSKYGDDWDKYTAIAKYHIIPYVY